jgi:hypothetical protein
MQEIWIKILKELNKENIPFLLVGGTALIIQGIPRTTLDIDIYLTTNKTNVKKLLLIANKLNLLSEQKTLLKIPHIEELITGQWITFETKDKKDIIDIYFEKEENFNKLYKNAVIKKIDNFNITVTCLEDLKKMKQNSKRAKDLADVSLINELIKNNKY